MEYAVVYEEGEWNWSAYVPDLPGCVATGKTREKAEANIKAAIRMHLHAMREDGDPIPPPTTHVGMVNVAA